MQKIVYLINKLFFDIFLNMTTTINDVNKYIIDGEQFKIKYSQYWNNNLEELIIKLKDIIDTASIDESDALKEFDQLLISTYDSFGSYAKSLSIDLVDVKVPTQIKEKKTKMFCQNCGSKKFTLTGDVYICNDCGSELSQKRQINQLIAKDITDIHKHIMKQLNTLTGESKPSSDMRMIVDYVYKWFIERKYMYSYLLYQDLVKDSRINSESTEVSEVVTTYKKKSSKLDKTQLGALEYFIAKYNLISKLPPIDESYFEQELIRDQDHVCNYNVFKLICDTFYYMTELVRRYNKLQSNLSNLSDADIVKLYKKYYEEFHEIPLNNTIYELHCLIRSDNTIDWKNTNKIVKFEIGNYTHMLMIHDIECTTYVKHQINEIYKDLLDNNIYHNKLTLPGLMFNFEQVCKKNKTFPKKFKYQQNHIYIVSNLYRIKPFNIIQNDKLLICDIIVKFNKFIKDRKKAASIKKTNAVLWNVSLSCVFSLPYFNCYKDIVKILPSKIESTTSAIMESWTLFKICKPEVFEKYETIRRTEVNINENVKTKITDAEHIRTEDIMNFINKTGSNYGESLTEIYLKEKNGTAEIDLEWKNQFTLK